MNIDDDCWRCWEAQHQQKERLKLSGGVVVYREQITSIVLNARVRFISQKKILRVSQVFFAHFTAV